MTMLDAMFGAGGLAVISQNLWRAIQYQAFDSVVEPIDIGAGVEPLTLRPEESDEGGMDYAHGLRVTIGNSNDAGGVTSPKINDAVIYGGSTYSVRKIISAGTHHVLECVRQAGHEMTRRNFRGSR